MSVSVSDAVLGPAAAREAHDGLTAVEVLEQRQRYGRNALPEARGPSVWSILLNQFENPLVYIILVAAAISLVVGEYGDFAIIMVVVVADAALGFVQEYQAQRTYSTLKSLLKPTTTVIRDGQRQEIALWELVPGDVVVLAAGERIAGDGQVIAAAKMAADEAILTGESEPVAKNTASGQDQVYMGTTLLTGRGMMRVTATGGNTELGKIATSLQDHIEDDTPLQIRLRAFSHTLTRIVLGLTVVILLVGVALGRGVLAMLRTSIILAVAAVPEGLLIAVTVILVLGMRKILKRNGLVRKLLAVETLGSVTAICSDKTGTLTEGRMRVTGFDPVDRERALETIALCNDLEGPVDVALWEYAQAQHGYDPEKLVSSSERLAEEPFSSEAKYMITQSRLDGTARDYLKGAPEIVLSMCDVSQEERDRLLNEVDDWASQGRRLLGLAWRQHGSLDSHEGYTWAGLIGMDDPVRPDVPEAISLAKRAGIQVKMITGDYRRTAERVARSIGLLTDGEDTVEGAELAEMSDEELKRRADDIAVFSRIRPQDKLRIVRALQGNSHIAAMIGDGVNDAPALTRANIGVVVGGATDVAKETADLVLLDSSFHTVVAAIEEGRVIFDNIQKVVAYTLSNSFAEVFTIFVAMILGWPTPLLIAQILWIHLICDGPADITLGFEPKEQGIMDQKPRSLKEPILTRVGLALIATISSVSAVAALVIFRHYWLQHGTPDVGRSMVFASFAINSMVYVFGYRSMRRSLLHMTSLRRNLPLAFSVMGGILLVLAPFVIRPLGALLGVVALSGQQWLVVAAIALLLLMTVELAKLIANRGHRRAEWAAPTT